ncbi:hypothetical protein ACFXAS_05565 [Streptomyces sp. NPDC059459]|uniref:hypothetical protein n=1 Tax=Streptomyces sp. NPDC059459 TaxID=3346839 RepID=UPI00368EBFD3
MADAPFLIEISDPAPASVRLPGLGGTIECQVIAVEVRPCGEMWVKVKAQLWQRWGTQVAVGEHAIEGIGPAWTECWAPSTAVDVDSDRGSEITSMVRQRKMFA